MNDDSSELAKSVETEAVDTGAKSGIADDKTEVLEPPLSDSPRLDPMEPSASEGVFSLLMSE